MQCPDTKESVSVPASSVLNLECSWQDSTDSLKSPNVLKSIDTVKNLSVYDFQASPSGTTSLPMNLQNSTEIAQLSGQDSPASQSQALVSSEVQTISAISGPTSSNSFARLDPSAGWVKTLTGYEQLTLDGSLQAFSKTFPKAGLLLNGVACQQPRWAQSISVNESGLLPIDQRLLPTPTASDAAMAQVLNDNTQIYYTKNGLPRKISNQGVDGSVGLTRFVQLMLPTPKASNSSDGNYRQNRTSGITALPKKPGQTLHLSAAVQNLPTPTARDSRKGKDAPNRRGGMSLVQSAEVGSTKMLNPFFVAMMMGFPPNWIDTSCDTTSLSNGSEHPQSPPSLGSLVQRLEAFRKKIKLNTSDSTKSTNGSSASTRTGSKLSATPSAHTKPPLPGQESDKSLDCVERATQLSLFDVRTEVLPPDDFSWFHQLQTEVDEVQQQIDVTALTKNELPKSSKEYRQLQKHLNVEVKRRAIAMQRHQAIALSRGYVLLPSPVVSDDGNELRYIYQLQEVS